MGVPYSETKENFYVRGAKFSTRVTGFGLCITPQTGCWLSFLIRLHSLMRRLSRRSHTC